MRLGRFQRAIVAYLAPYGEDGGHIGATTASPHFRGFLLEDVERAMAAMFRRRLLIRKSSVRIALSPELLKLARTAGTAK